MLYGAVRSGLATGRLHGLSALGALRATLEGRSLLSAPAAEEPGQAPLGGLLLDPNPAPHASEG